MNNTILNKTYLILLCLLLILASEPLNAQKSDKNKAQSPYLNQLGLQLNPYLDKNLVEGYLMEVVYGIRYAYNVTPNFSTGPEIAGYAPIYFKSGDNMNHFKIGVGVFARYSFFTESRVRVFTEVSPYYSYWYREETQFIPEKRESKLGVCLSPGLSLFSKSRKLSIDLYMKFSNLEFVNNRNFVFSYKVNYHF